MFAHLKYEHNATLVFDPTCPTIKYKYFPVHDWTTFYGDVEKTLPSDAPIVWGKGFDMICYIDEYLAGNIITR